MASYKQAWAGLGYDECVYRAAGVHPAWLFLCLVLMMEKVLGMDSFQLRKTQISHASPHPTTELTMPFPQSLNSLLFSVPCLSRWQQPSLVRASFLQGYPCPIHAPHSTPEWLKKNRQFFSSSFRFTVKLNIKYRVLTCPLHTAGLLHWLLPGVRLLQLMNLCWHIIAQVHSLP